MSPVTLVNRAWWKMWGSRWNRVDSSSRSGVANYFRFRVSHVDKRSMSGDVDSDFGYSVVVENVGVAVEILSIHQRVPNCRLFPG